MRTDPISDLLTRVRNAQRIGHRSVRIIKSDMAGRVLNVLKVEGFVEKIEMNTKEGEKFEEFEVTLKYYGNGSPAIRRAVRMSKPGRRLYSHMDKIPHIECGLGISIISTSQGVMSDREARKRKIGGEVIATIS